MYIIFDKTNNNSIKIEGDYPWKEIEELLKSNHDIEVLSTYSNTLKFNYKLVWNNVIFEYEVECDEISY